MTNGNGEADDRARIRDDALSVLRDALEWSLTPAEWSGVAAILSRLGADAGALDLAEPGQRKAVEDATVWLELAGPRRIEAVDHATESVPPDVHERLNMLIEELSRSGEEGGIPGGKQ
jgi:hypothetical protein